MEIKMGVGRRNVCFLILCVRWYGMVVCVDYGKG